MYPPPEPGDRVRIIEGTYKSFVGVVADLPGGDDGTVMVMLNIFGGDAAMAIDPAALELA